jgi:hypothetical protein
VDLAAYRIIQESLTNAIRHAGPATAAVSLTYGQGELRIEVTDTGRGTAAGTPGAGHGLTGMRERAASAGGTVEAGPRPAGGYRVSARLPTGHPRGTGVAGAAEASGAGVTSEVADGAGVPSETKEASGAGEAKEASRAGVTSEAKEAGLTEQAGAGPDTDAPSPERTRS